MMNRSYYHDYYRGWHAAKRVLEDKGLSRMISNAVSEVADHWYTSDYERGYDDALLDEVER